MANQNDGVRDKILRYLHGAHKGARGRNGQALGIRDIQSAMKQHGVKQQETIANLDYLVQKGWVREVSEKKTFTTPGGTVKDRETKRYKISDVGIDKLEGASLYQREETLSRINVTNVHGVTVIGRGNVVNAGLTDLSRVLTELEQTVARSTSLNDEDRLNALSDLQTIQAQLSKPKPNGGIIKMAWGGIEKLSTIADMAGLITQAYPIIQKLMEDHLLPV